MQRLAQVGALVCCCGPRLDTTAPMFFSVIIPAYNVERYIRECVMSAVQQQHQGAHEVIVVDDGSTDDTNSILRELVTSTSVVQLIEQANDGSPGKARNAGIQVARGDYLVFLDSDDRLPQGTLACFQEAARDHRPCVIAGARNVVNDSSQPISTQELAPALLGRHELDGKLQLAHRSLYLNASGKAFRAGLVKDHDLRFTEGHPSQDTAFSLQVFANAELLVGVDAPVYDVRIRDDANNPSLTQQFDNQLAARRMVSARQCVERLLAAGQTGFAADAAAYFLLGLLRRALHEHKRGRVRDPAGLQAVFAHYRHWALERVDASSMGTKIRLLWTVATGITRSPLRLRLALRLMTALGLG